MKKKKKNSKIDFEKALTKGRKSYDSAVGDWWQRQAGNQAHAKAYRRVVDYMARHRTRGGGFIVDYACGDGRFLEHLAPAFPNSPIVALDGSRKMLQACGARLERIGVEAGEVPIRKAFDAKGPRVRLVESMLPNFSLAKGKADMVAFVFPNIAPSVDDQDYYNRHGYRNPRDVAVARMLARFREMDPEDEVSTDEPEVLFDGLMTERVISRNLRGLLRKGGRLFKVDYANSHREGLSRLTNWRTSFGEGALEEPIKDKRVEAFFRLRDCDYARSSVILDVFHQTRDPSDRTGGYFISRLDAE